MRRSAGWVARRSRCRTAFRSRRRPSRRARTSSDWSASHSEENPMPEINMPKLSDTMEEGTIVEWKKKSGDQVKAGEVVAEVESDKATFDLEAESDGVLQILVEQGVPAKIGAPIAKIGEAGAQAKSESAPAKSESAPAKSEPAPAKQAPAQKGGAAEPKPKE